MRAFAAALGMAVLLASPSASAEKVGWVNVKNGERHAVTVEFRIGPSNACERNSEFVGRQIIPPGDVWKLTVRGENTACLRLVGRPKWWSNKVNHGQVHSWVVQ